MKKYRPEQVVEKLRQAEVELGKGLSVKEVCRVIEVCEQTLLWRVVLPPHTQCHRPEGWGRLLGRAYSRARGSQSRCGQAAKQPIGLLLVTGES